MLESVQILYLDSPAVDQNKDELYRIGTVASLTGISVERLRAWERRHDLTPAHRDGRTRFYSAEQLEHLRLIKRLTDLGHPISSIATLSTQQLKDRIEREQDQPQLYATSAPTVGLVGPNLMMLEQKTTSGSRPVRIDVVSRWANINAFVNDQNGTDDPQILFLQLPVLSIQPIEFAKKTYPDAKLVVIYQFAAAKQITELGNLEIPTLKWPVDWSQIEHIAISQHGLSGDGGVTPRRYSDEELIAIATNNDDPTEAPTFVIESIQQLNALSAYVQDCALSAPQDAPYASTAQDVSRARAQLELALNNLVGGEFDEAES